MSAPLDILYENKSDPDYVITKINLNSVEYKLPVIALSSFPLTPYSLNIAPNCNNIPNLRGSFKLENYVYNSYRFKISYKINTTHFSSSVSSATDYSNNDITFEGNIQTTICCCYTYGTNTTQSGTYSTLTITIYFPQAGGVKHIDRYRTESWMTSNGFYKLGYIEITGSGDYNYPETWTYPQNYKQDPSDVGDIHEINLNNTSFPLYTENHSGEQTLTELRFYFDHNPVFRTYWLGQYI